MTYYVYVLMSEKDSRLYKGMTSDIVKRLKEHNAGRNFSTKPYIPWKLIYSKSFENRLSAREYEKYLKSGVGREFLKILKNKTE